MHFMHMVDMQSMQNMTSPVPYFEYSNCSCNRQERGSLLWSAAKHSSDTSTRPVASPSPAPAADWLPPLLQAAAAVNTTAAIFCSILQYATAYSSSIQEIQYFCALPIKMWWEKKLIWKWNITTKNGLKNVYPAVNVVVEGVLRYVLEKQALATPSRSDNSIMQWLRNSFCTQIHSIRIGLNKEYHLNQRISGEISSLACQEDPSGRPSLRCIFFCISRSAMKTGGCKAFGIFLTVCLKPAAELRSNTGTI
jgi:hypothetical protein